MLTGVHARTFDHLRVAEPRLRVEGLVREVRLWFGVAGDRGSATLVGGGGRTGAGDRTEVFDGGVNGARTPHRERAFAPVREHSRRPAARVFANFSRCHAGNGRGAGHPARARAASGARVETTRALVPRDIPQGGLATFTTAHIAPRMLSRLFEWRGPRRRTRARSARHVLRGQNRQKRASVAAPAFFVCDESTSHKPPTRHDTHESRSGRTLPRPGTNRTNRRIQVQFLGRLPTLVELYCGNGNHTCALASRFARAVAVEIEPTLVAAARENFKVNGVDNADVHERSPRRSSRATRRTRWRASG